MTNETKTAQQIAADIRQWDCTMISDLIDMIDELRAVLAEEHGDDLHGAMLAEYDLIGEGDSLPSADIPDDIDTSYPVWACDVAGDCIVGDWSRRETELGNGWQVEHVTQIRDTQQGIVGWS